MGEHLWNEASVYLSLLRSTCWLATIDLFHVSYKFSYLCWRTNGQEFECVSVRFSRSPIYNRSTTISAYTNSFIWFLRLTTYNIITYKNIMTYRLGKIHCGSHIILSCGCSSRHVFMFIKLNYFYYFDTVTKL